MQSAVQFAMGLGLQLRVSILRLQVSLQLLQDLRSVKAVMAVAM